MKKLIFLSLMLICAFTVSAQSNYSSPGIPPGTTTFTPTFRYKPATPDSLAQIWQSITGNKWFRMSTGMDDIVFSAINFKGAGTTSSKLDLNNSIIISGTATTGQGFLTGDITNTAHQGYFTKSLVGSNGVTGAFSVSSKLGGGASINSITGSGAVHVISLPNLANPYFSPDSGAHNYPLLAVANFVGLTYDTTTYTLTATGSGGAFLPLSFTGDNTVSLNGHEFDISDTNLTYSLSNSSFLQRMLTSSSSTGIIQGSATLNMNAVDQITGDNAAIEVDQGPVAAFISTQLATSGFEKKLLLSAVSGNGIAVTDQIDNIGLNGAVVFPKVYGTQYAQYSKVDSTINAKIDSLATGGGGSFINNSDITSSPQNASIWLDNANAMQVGSGSLNSQMSNGNIAQFVSGTGFVSMTHNDLNWQSGASHTYDFHVDSAGNKFTIGASSGTHYLFLSEVQSEYQPTNGNDLIRKRDADSLYAPISGSGVTSVSAGTGMSFTTITSTGAVKADTTVLQTVLNFFPKGDSRYLKISSAPTGANPTATAGTSAVNGSAATFMRSDAAPKVDSSVFRTVANSQTLAQTQTALNLKANLASPTFTGTPAAPTATVGTNTTQIATTAFVTAAVAGGGGGVSTVGSFSGSSQTNGASISGSTITFGPADSTNPGMVSTATQAFTGQKSFTQVLMGGITSQPSTNSIVWVGDSITLGSAGIVTTANRFTTRVSVALGYTEDNRGVGGETAHSTSVIPTHTSGMSILYIALGTNDLHGGDSPSTFQTNLGALVTYALAHGWTASQIFVQSMYGYQLPTTNVELTTANLLLFNTAIQNVVTANPGVTYVDAYTSIANSTYGLTNTMSPDGIHANDYYGSPAIFNCVVNRLPNIYTIASQPIAIEGEADLSSIKYKTFAPTTTGSILGISNLGAVAPLFGLPDKTRTLAELYTTGSISQLSISGKSSGAAGSPTSYLPSAYSPVNDFAGFNSGARIYSAYDPNDYAYLELFNTSTGKTTLNNIFSAGTIDFKVNNTLGMSVLTTGIVYFPLGISMTSSSAYIDQASGSGYGRLQLFDNAGNTYLRNSYTTGVFNWYMSGGTTGSQVQYMRMGTTGRTIWQNGGTFTDNGTDQMQIGGSIISGKAGTTLGTYNLAGNTSGTISIKPQAAAGTYEFDMPITAGLAGQMLTSQGGAGTAQTYTYPISKPHNISTPTTGGTVSLTNNQYNIINPAGTLATLTINLPSSPANNDCVYIKYTQSITTVTYSGGTVVDGITAPTAGGLVVLTYDSGTTSWY